MAARRTIADQVSELAKARASRDPDAPASPFALEQAALAAAGVPAGVISVGSKLPDAEMLDVHGQPTTLYDALGDQPAVLVTYRGAWCPYCNIALNTYQSELLPELDRRGVALLAVNPQAPDESLSMQEKNELTFTVLSDPGNRLSRELGVVITPSEAARAAQLARGLDIAAGNVDGTPEIPMPTAVVVDADHIVRWVDVHPDYTTRSEPEEILAALDATA
jgi:peroxiredoxin